MRAAPRAHRLPAVHAVLSYAVMAEAGLLPVPARRIVLAARLLAKARALPEGDPLRAVADADPAQAQVRDGLAPGRDRGLASRRRGPAVGAVVPGPAAGMRWPTHRLSAYSRTSAPLRRDSTLDETLRVNSSRRSRNGPSGSGRPPRQPEEWISCWSPLLQLQGRDARPPNCHSAPDRPPGPGPPPCDYLYTYSGCRPTAATGATSAPTQSPMKRPRSPGCTSR